MKCPVQGLLYLKIIVLSTAVAPRHDTILERFPNNKELAKCEAECRQASAPLTRTDQSLGFLSPVTRDNGEYPCFLTRSP